ncbi:putative leucine-rich repeat-containing protein DDB_G0290503 [Centruroides vittatus]|uniref:putative leucine-rich repeat-containing protein DDB_G0290503 n=1 Tax=Centruroides vittatus TaxID=120091 RepID=UPI003510730B
MDSEESKLEKSAETKLSEKSAETKLSEKSSETKLIDSRSDISDTSFKEPAAFQEDMAKFWESTTVNSRITALESGLEKIIDIIDEQARDLEHFRRDTERRRTKDNNNTKNLQLNLEELCQTTNKLITKMESCVTEEGFQMALEENGKHVLQINNKLQDVDDRLLNLNNKLEGDYEMHEVLDDITDIKSILKIPTRKQLASQFGTENIQYGEYPPDMQQILGAAINLEELQTKVTAVEEKVERIAESNKEMLRMRAEEAIANEEKMAETEAIIENLSLYVDTAKEKMSDFHESLNVLSKKLSNLTDTITEIVKIQDDMTVEGRKNLQDVEDQLKEICKELKKLSMIDDIQVHVEDIRNYKADRSEMIDELEKKADKTQLDEKVNKSEYLTSREEINSGFNDIIAKISGQEQAMERTIQDLTVLTNQKLERKEMDNYKENLKERLKTIVAKLKQLKEAVEEGPSAAGVKLRCISCDRSLRPNERNVVISDGSHNATMPKRIGDQLLECQGYLPPLQCADRSNRSVGGLHTLTTPPLYLRKASTVGSQSTKIWEEVPLQGSDGRIYRGYLEKSERVRV